MEQMTDSISKSTRKMVTWLLLCAAGCIWISFFGEKMPSKYMAKLFGIFVCVLMVILSRISIDIGDISFTGLIEAEKAAVLSGDEQKKLAVVMWIIFLAGTVGEVLYAYYGITMKSMSLMKDSLCTAGIFTVTCLAARKISYLLIDSWRQRSEEII